ncbi:MAG: Unknown protein [uncultured Sulfurovum sp.]|uniref:DUF4178 domain-containing protein n=1 Tax=uncultured Sulfurovum sp. TaxID=269237 RepID=A0A6S6U4Q8_9BACT|nr:MAG: Unknown protein [uncultured Sulfurovum sp.]
MLSTRKCPQCKATLDKSTASVQNCQYCQTLLLQVNEAFSTIKCKGCSAPLKLEGELSNSKILVCTYCSTAMDSEHEFKALYTFTNIQKPNSRLEVGMRMSIEGIEYAIVSLIVYRSRGSEWLDFTLYSKGSKYAKLLKKEGKYLFFNKELGNMEENIWLLKAGDIFKVQDTSFQIEKFYFTEIYYAVGNMSSKINQNQRNKQCLAKNDSTWFYSAYSLNNVTYYVGRELDEVEQTFKD